MNILVLNSGSSSIKYQLLNMENEEELAQGIIERIGFEDSIVSYKCQKGKSKETLEVQNHLEGIKIVLNKLTNSDIGVLSTVDEIQGVGHRITQGGNYFTKNVIVDSDVKEKINLCSEIAPLHNPPQLKGIEAIEAILPNVTNVAVFDTVFHKDIPEYASTYAIPKEWREKYNIKKYGFHGMSHDYISKRAAEILEKDPQDFKMVSAHLGNGASVCAVKNGESVDTTMGFTPLQGLIMGTRCGDIDTAIVPFIMEKEGLSAKEVDNILNKECGVKALSELSSDFRDIENQIFDNGPKKEEAKLALAAFDYKVKFYISAYIGILNGADALVLTGGLGENSKETRESICKNLEYLGIEIDKSKNNFRGEERIISKDTSKIKVLVIPTNEELVIGREVKRLLNN